MERIHYATGTLETGSDISRAVLNYAEALALRHSSATVDIPVRREDGSNGRANLLLGPASQLVAETLESPDEDEIIDEALVAKLVQLTKRLEISRAHPMHPDDDLGSLDIYEDTTDHQG